MEKLKSLLTNTHERYARAWKLRGFESAKHCAEFLGKEERTIQHQLQTTTWCDEIATQLGISKNWLLLGTNEMEPQLYSEWLKNMTLEKRSLLGTKLSRASKVHLSGASHKFKSEGVAVPRSLRCDVQLLNATVNPDFPYYKYHFYRTTMLEAGKIALCLLVDAQWRHKDHVIAVLPEVYRELLEIKGGGNATLKAVPPKLEIDLEKVTEELRRTICASQRVIKWIAKRHGVQLPGQKPVRSNTIRSGRKAPAAAVA